VLKAISIHLAIALSPTESAAYDSGYSSGSALGHRLGEFLGQAVNQFGPYIGLLSLVVVVWALSVRSGKLST